MFRPCILPVRSSSVHPRACGEHYPRWPIGSDFDGSSPRVRGTRGRCRDIIARHPEPSESVIRSQLSGQICRCTGYAGIVAAIASAAKEIREIS